MPVCRAGTIVWASGLAAAWAATTAWAGHSSIAFALYSPLAAFGALQVSPWYGAALCIGSLVALCAAPPAERTGAVLTALALVAVSGAAIHAAYRQRTEREDFSRIVSVVQRVSASLDAGEVIATVVSAAREATGAKASSLRLLAPDQHTLVVRAAEGLSKAYMDKGPVDVRRNPLDRKVLAGQIVQVRDVTTDPLFLYRDQAREEGIVSLLCVPLRQKDQIVGVLRVYSAYPRRFGPREIRIVTAMAAQAVVALRHAELHQTALAFMRKVAHELRAPLAAVSTNLKVLLEGGLTASEEQRLRMLQRADQRIVLLLETVNDLLSLSRARLQKPSEDATSLRLQQVVGSVVALMRPQAEAAGVAVSVDAAEDAPPVVGNPYEIEELIGNLVSNAMKYTPRGGQITAAVEQRDDEVVVRVADTGIGIPADEMPRLFQEFHRCANARRSDIVGTGLGMVIVKTIADRHHAVLRVESEEGKGTTVEVAFPLGEPA
jgi:signal transduction histidine kinase